MNGLLKGRRRPVADAFLFFSLAAGLACGDFGPNESGVAAIAVVPTFSRQALQSFDRASLTGVSINNVRLRLERVGGAVAGDTSISLALGQDSVVIEAAVRLSTSPELLKARLELRFGSLVLFAGATDVLAVAGAASDVPLIAMDYVGPVDPGIPIVSRLVLASTGTLSGVVGKLLPLPVVVQALDAAGTPVPNVPVSWTLSGGGSLAQPTTVTDDAGQAAAAVTLGTATGVQTVSAAVSGVTPVVANLFAIADVPTVLGIVREPSAIATAGIALVTQPVVRLLDQYGNEVSSSGIPIAATLANATGLLLDGPATAVTDFEGVATFQHLRIFGVAGPAALTFSQASLAPATSRQIDVEPGLPTRVELMVRPSASVITGAVLGRQPAARVTDTWGNTVASSAAVVTAGAPAGVTLLGNTSETATNGIAQFTNLGLLGTLGSLLLTFRSPGLASDTASVTILPISLGVWQPRP